MLYLTIVKKLVLLLLALIVPVQLAWAAVTCYNHADYPAETTHQIVSADEHHHVHEHGASKASAKLDAPAEDSHSAHCDACHAHMMTLLEQTASTIVDAIGSEPIVASVRLLVSKSSDPPYRPKWQDT